MSGTPDTRELALKVARMEGDMNALHSDVKAALERNNAAFDRLRADMERRDKDNTRWQIGLVIAAVVVLGILIRWPG